MWKIYETTLISADINDSNEMESAHRHDLFNKINSEK
jgi:hypothetical protein